jgi:hypothetical protein
MRSDAVWPAVLELAAVLGSGVLEPMSQYLKAIAW